MAYFARQKRQSRFYWAELGFLALGLLGLQPSLIINLIMGSQAKSSPNANPVQQAFQNQPVDFYRDPSVTHLASYYPMQQWIGATGSAQASMPYAATAYGQIPYNGQLAYGQYAQALQYAQFAPLSQPTTPNGWQNQPVYLAQANTGYSTAGMSGTANSNQWSTSQANNYGNRVGSNQSSPTYSGNSFANAGTYPYNLQTPRTSQQSVFENGYNSNYDTGRANTASAPQSYSYPSSSAKPSTWQRYQPTNPVYR